MTKADLAGGTVHPVTPKDLAEALFEHPQALETWVSATPLARNEWICLVQEAKKPETRKRRIVRAYDQLSRGQRRPCCWQGCPHRTKSRS